MNQANANYPAIGNLLPDLANYREAMDRIFVSDLVKSSDWREYFMDLLIRAARLYLDYLLVMRNMPAMEAAASSKGDYNLVGADIFREKALREHFQQKLGSSICWNRDFEPKNAFSDSTGLRSRKDYEKRLVVDLPEIYEESIRVEACAKEFLASQSASALADLGVGLQHLGRNHISFVMQALEWAADELSWREPG